MPIKGLTESQKAKVHAAMARAKGAAAHFARGAKGTAYAGVTGAGCFYVGRELYNRFDVFQKNTYALPLVFLLGGHVLKKKQYDVGTAMVGVAGFVGAQSYQAAADQKKKEAGGTPGTMTTPPAGALVDPAGYAALDVPMLHARRDAGMVVDAGAVVQPRAARSFLELSDIDDRRHY